MSSQSFPFHNESAAMAHASADRVFAYLDDPKALAAHMGEPSIMMLGSRMSMETDADGGRRVGSKIRMRGSLLGIPLSLEEVITERNAPFGKTWETVGTPKLLVIGNYRMRFALTPKGVSSLVNVSIDYELPTTAPGSWLGYFFGGIYARWCTKRMADDAADHFNTTTPGSA
jgi:Polyketide cyclase / dehydrase and lipid transport